MKQPCSKRPYSGYLCTVLLGILCFAQSAIARPVSYPKGWTVMNFNGAEASRLHVHYSPTVRYSIGYLGQYNWRVRSPERWRFHGMQINHLAFRYNQLASQTNLYLKSGLGVFATGLDNIDTLDQPAGFIGLAVDWETRRYFFAYQNRFLYARDSDWHTQQSIRFGIAPYIGDYGDLHTWLFLQINHSPRSDPNARYSFIVRFFKGVGMTEIGVDHVGSVLFNWVVRI